MSSEQIEGGAGLLTALDWGGENGTRASSPRSEGSRHSGMNVGSLPAASVLTFALPWPTRTIAAPPIAANRAEAPFSRLVQMPQTVQAVTK